MFWGVEKGCIGSEWVSIILKASPDIKTSWLTLQTVVHENNVMFSEIFPAI